MSGFTQGPLTFEVTDSQKWDERGDCGILDADGKVIAETFATVARGFGGKRPALANARLFAAAPDLLEVCRNILDAEDAGYWAGPSEYIAQLRAAIDKATGEAAT